MARRASTSTTCSASTAGWTRCRRWCCPPSCAGWPAGTRPGGPRPPRYDALLAGQQDIVLPRTLDGNEHVWHLYVVRVPDRDRVLKELQAAGIGASIHYPVPIHLTEAFAGLGYAEGAFPVTERAAAEILSLPLFARSLRLSSNAWPRHSWAQ